MNAIVHQRYKTEGPGSDPPRNDMMPGPPTPQTSHNPSFVCIHSSFLDYTYTCIYYSSIVVILLVDTFLNISFY